MNKHGRRTDDQSFLGKLRVAFLRYGVIGVAIVTVPAWMPLVEEYFTGRMLERMQIIIRGEIHEAHSQNNAVTDDVLLRVARTAVAVQSIHKVEYIRSLIQHKDLGNGITRRRIKQDIANELKRQSVTYISFLNSFYHPRLGRVGSYIERTFPMKEFLKNVSSLVLDNGNNTEAITQDVMRYMLHTQDIYFAQMQRELEDT